MSARHAFARAVALALLTAPGAAQQAPPTPPVETPTPRGIDPKACAPSDRLQPGDTNPRAPAATTGENLSDKLARTDGVICPPAGVDPGIHEPPPAGGRTPVIPPPGTPGGDQSVRPK
jgi:hypothetical protein